MRFFFGTHGFGFVFGHIPEAGFLNDSFTLIQHAGLAFDFVFNRLLHKLETVHVFDFSAGAEFLSAFFADGNVGVTAQRTFFHIAVRNVDIKQNAFQGGQVSMGFIRTADIRFGNNFDERNTATVVIGQRIVGRIQPA